MVLLFRIQRGWVFKVNLIGLLRLILIAIYKHVIIHDFCLVILFFNYLIRYWFMLVNFWVTIIIINLHKYLLISWLAYSLKYRSQHNNINYSFNHLWLLFLLTLLLFLFENLLLLFFDCYLLRNVNVINLEVELNLVDLCYVVWACEAFSFENWCLLYMLWYPVHYLNWRIGSHAFVHIVWIWLVILLLLKL